MTNFQKILSIKNNRIGIVKIKLKEEKTENPKVREFIVFEEGSRTIKTEGENETGSQNTFRVCRELGQCRETGTAQIERTSQNNH